MKSRYIRLLESKRSAAESVAEKSFIELQIADYYARKGSGEAANEIIARIRQSNIGRADARIVAQINFVEGILLHLAGSDIEAEKKWKRSIAIAGTVDAIEVLSCVSGWMSFLKYTNGKFDALFDELNSCLRQYLIDSHRGSLTARAEMVIALVLHTCLRTRDALWWYEKARRTSLLNGDDVELAALVHNMAWIRLYNYRNSVLRGSAASQSEPEILRVSAEAVQSYEELVGLETFPAMTPLLQAQNFMIQENYASALDILNEHARSVTSQGLSRLAPNFEADRAFCMIRLGRYAEARDAVDYAINGINSYIHPDDLAVLYCRLRDYFFLVGESSLSSEYAAKAEASWSDFDDLTKSMLDKLEKLVKNGLPGGDSVPQH